MAFHGRSLPHPPILLTVPDGIGENRGKRLSVFFQRFTSISPGGKGRVKIDFDVIVVINAFFSNFSSALFCENSVDFFYNFRIPPRFDGHPTFTPWGISEKNDSGQVLVSSVCFVLKKTCIGMAFAS
jgi:hypothetical protein